MCTVPHVARKYYLAYTGNALLLPLSFFTSRNPRHAVLQDIITLMSCACMQCVPRTFYLAYTHHPLPLPISQFESQNVNRTFNTYILCRVISRVIVYSACV